MWKSCECFFKRLISEEKEGIVNCLLYYHCSRLNFESSKLVQLGTSLVKDPRRYERSSTWIAKIVYTIISSDEWHMFIVLVLLALENLFPIGMDDQLEIWKRKTWIVTERSWGRICILQPGTFFAGETGYFVALPTNPDWFIYAVKDTLLSDVRGSFWRIFWPFFLRLRDIGSAWLVLKTKRRVIRLLSMKFRKNSLFRCNCCHCKFSYGFFYGFWNVKIIYLSVPQFGGS